MGKIFQDFKLGAGIEGKKFSSFSGLKIASN